MLLRKARLQITIFAMRKTLKRKDKTCHKSQKNVQNVSEFKKIKFRKIRIEKYYYVKRHFLHFRAPSKSKIFCSDFHNASGLKKLYNVSDFLSNPWKRVRSWEKFAFKGSLYQSCYSEKTTFFCIFPAFAKCMTLN